MAQCAACGKTIRIGGVKDLDVRYCNQACRGKDFFKRYNAARERAAALNPDPLPAVRPAPPVTATPEETIDPDPGRRRASEMAIIGLGFAVMAIVVALIWLIHRKVEYQFFSLTVWFVIPVGAFLCGILAGSGFLLGHRMLNRLPTTLTKVAAFIGGMAGYVLIFGLSWWFLEVGNVRIRDIVGFPQYLKVMVENQTVQFRHGGQVAPPIDLGKWGYARFAIDLAGFAFGVMSMVAIAGRKAYCARCGRYLTKVGEQKRNSSDPEAAATTLHPVIAGVLAGRIQEAVDLHAAWDATDRKGFLSTTINVETCVGCGMHLATLSAICLTDNGVQPVDGFAFQGRTDQRVHVSG